MCVKQRERERETEAATFQNVQVTHEDWNMHIQQFLSSDLSGSTVEEDAGSVAERVGKQQTWQV